MCFPRDDKRASWGGGGLGSIVALYARSPLSVVKQAIKEDSLDTKPRLDPSGNLRRHSKRYVDPIAYTQGVLDLVDPNGELPLCVLPIVLHHPQWAPRVHDILWCSFLANAVRFLIVIVRLLVSPCVVLWAQWGCR